MAGPQDVALSGNNDIDALLTGYRWDTNNLTFSFPEDGWPYVIEQFFDIATPEQIAEFLAISFFIGPVAAITEHFLSVVTVGAVSLNGFQEFNAAQKDSARAAVAQFTSIAPITLTEGDEGLLDHEIIRFGETGTLSAPALGIPPLPRVELVIGNGVLGDTWFMNDGQFDNPMLGNFADFTILHELGHAMGLKHGHEDGLLSEDFPDFIEEVLTDVSGPILDDAVNSIEFTVMTYRSAPDGPNSLQAEAGGYSQSLMMLDIQAIQYMYGANFNHNAGDNTYTWNPSTGTMSIDGVAQRTPAINRVFMTIWDGDGNDTYDLSAYSTSVSINLLPGQWTITSEDQFADLNGGSRDNGLARGNIANALLFEGDTRSLIENAIGGGGDDTLTGNDGDNTLTGNGGNDTITGALGNDTLNGGDGDDTLDGGDGHDTLNGGAGNDNLTGGAGNDTLNGGDGNDVMAGGDGDDSLNGGAGNDTMTGAAGIDTLVGGDGEDSLDGGDGDDTLSAGAGNDVVEGGAGNDGIDGGDGDDTLRGGPGNDTILGGAGADSIEGGDGNDVLMAGLGDDTVLGGAGSDNIDGGEGNDSLSGGGDDDTITGGAGLDVILGGAGNDVIDSGADADEVHGGDGDDTIVAGGGNDVVTGDAGNDNIDTGDGDDTVDGNDGNDTILAGAGNDLATGGIGNDTIDAGEGDNTVGGGDGNDSIVAGAGNDQVIAGAGDDTVDAGDGNNTVDGGDGNDVLVTGAGEDTVTGGIGDDLIRGGDGVDLLLGGAGNDTIFGQGGNDSLFGEDGDDTLAGGEGQDLVDGGNGIDTASYVDATGPVVVNLQDPTQMTGDASGDVYISIEKFELSNFDDTFIGRDDPLVGDVVSGLDGDDTLLGFAGDDELHGDGGNDYIVGGEGADIVDGGAGFDTTSFEESQIGIVVDLVDPSRNTGIAEGDTITSVEQFFLTLQADEFVGLAADETIHGLHGNDLIFTNGGNDRVFAGDQHDTVFGGTGNDLLLGENGNDTIDSGDGNDVIEGGADHDVLIGGDGADVIRGGTGDDYIAGDAGNDILWGDDGKDTFAFAANGWGFDLVMDFQDKRDRISIDFDQAKGIHGMDELVVTERIGLFGTETAITLASGDPGEIVLVGMKANQVNHQDIEFV